MVGILLYQHILSIDFWFSHRKADNPIVFASDGFVKVTGYQRSEVIPRNCRFLQGRHTDRTPINRLKAAIHAREEVVELILNYKKNGDPFWNLLYVCQCEI
jgi:PAS domain-containing protein